jgi:hypothetical protein
MAVLLYIEENWASHLTEIYFGIRAIFFVYGYMCVYVGHISIIRILRIYHICIYIIIEDKIVQQRWHTSQTCRPFYWNYHQITTLYLNIAYMPIYGYIWVYVVYRRVNTHTHTHIHQHQMYLPSTMFQYATNVISMRNKLFDGSIISTILVILVFIDNRWWRKQLIFLRDYCITTPCRLNCTYPNTHTHPHTPTRTPLE